MPSFRDLGKVRQRRDLAKPSYRPHAAKSPLDVLKAQEKGMHCIDEHHKTTESNIEDVVGIRECARKHMHWEVSDIVVHKDPEHRKHQDRQIHTVLKARHKETRNELVLRHSVHYLEEDMELVQEMVYAETAAQSLEEVEAFRVSRQGHPVIQRIDGTCSRRTFSLLSPSSP